MNDTCDVSKTVPEDLVSMITRKPICSNGMITAGASLLSEMVLETTI